VKRQPLDRGATGAEARAHLVSGSVTREIGSHRTGGGAREGGRARAGRDRSTLACTTLGCLGLSGGGQAYLARRRRPAEQ